MLTADSGTPLQESRHAAPDLSPLPPVSPIRGVSVTTAAAAHSTIVEEGDQLLRRAEVQDYIAAVNAAITGKLEGGAPSPRKVRLSTLAPAGGLGSALGSRRDPLAAAVGRSGLSSAALQAIPELKPEFLRPVRSQGRQCLYLGVATVTLSCCPR